MKIKHVLLAAAIAFAPAAHAATITKTYTLNTTFTDGIAPATESQTFTLTFDPTAQILNGSITSYTSTSNFASFNPAKVTYTSGFHEAIYPASVYSLYFGGPDNASGFYTGTNAFETELQVYADGSLYRSGSAFGYAVASDNKAHSASSAFAFDTTAGSTPTSAVPEAATWAMMVVGIGLVGGALRQRRQPVTVRFA